MLTVVDMPCLLLCTADFDRQIDFVSIDGRTLIMPQVLENEHKKVRPGTWKLKFETSAHCFLQAVIPWQF
jgi:hypothetical protein